MEHFTVSGETVNIKRVSQEAGVSTATVSRVLHKSDSVSEKTRIKVMKVVTEMGYQPDLLARSFRMRRSFTLLVIVPDITNAFFSRIIRSAERTASLAKFKVVLGDTEGSAEKEDVLATMVRTRQAEGILHLSPNLPGSLQTADGKLDKKFAFVNACELINEQEIPSVSFENADGGRQMAEHLLALGHRHIALVVGPVSSPLNAERIRGFNDGVMQSGIDDVRTPIVKGDFSIAAGAAAADEILQWPEMPTAIFCFSDDMAIGVMHRLHSSGISVPEQVSVAGFDDTTYAEFANPPLTTIAQPTEDIGRLAMEMLIDIVEERAVDVRKVVLNGKLVARASTGPAR
jgi:LacI family transcriptional regulator, repressor for deo operon, udp, cdd, tsx, nupC, and nupG